MRFRALITGIFLAGLMPTASAYWYDRVVTSSINLAPGEISEKIIQGYTTKIAFASESGALYGGVYVRIFNASGIQIFGEMCEKPLLYLRLPAGDYHVIAIDRKQTQRVAPFSVAKGQEHTTTLKLKWPRDSVGY